MDGHHSFGGGQGGGHGRDEEFNGVGFASANRILAQVERAGMQLLTADTVLLDLKQAFVRDTRK